MEDMTDRFTDSLSDYLDGELTPEDRREVGRHLETCAACAATLADLERVMEQARALVDRDPARDLWPAIAARLASHEAPAPVAAAPVRQAKKPWAMSFTWPELAAAGIAVVALSTATFWLGTRGEKTVSPVSTAQGLVVDPASHRNDSEAAIVELREALAKGRGDLDTSTVRVLEQNLLVIERSIAEARTALAADPANPYLRRHLQETIGRKVSLMHQATFLASAP